jgi:ATPase subunit of ABC transporter with duplicated ATPase domains
VLSATDVSFSRHNRVVLDRVSLSVGPGARLGVVGPNGIGKSTLLRIQAGQITPESGLIYRAPPSMIVRNQTQ